MTVYLLAEPLAKSGEAAKSGPIGFAVILVLCVACYFLFKSMSKHLRKVREEFPADTADNADTLQPELPDGPAAVDDELPAEPAPHNEPADS
jgi:hypothetical protein